MASWGAHPPEHWQATESLNIRCRVLIRLLLTSLLALVAYGAFILVCTNLPFQLPAQCFTHRRGVLSGGSKGGRLQPTCTATENMELHYTDVYQEAYKQFKVCLKVTSSSSDTRQKTKYLTLDRKLSSSCDPSNQFVLQPIGRSQSLYCIYSPVRGQFISTQGRPQSLCKDTERWRVTGALHRHEVLRWLASFGPNFVRPDFMVNGPALAIAIYCLVALWEVNRPRMQSADGKEEPVSSSQVTGRSKQLGTETHAQTHRGGKPKMGILSEKTPPTTTSGSLVAELLSMAFCFLMSLHVLFFITWAIENFVYGATAYREIADAHWYQLARLEEWIGISPVVQFLRSALSPNLKEMTYTHGIVTSPEEARRYLCCDTLGFLGVGAHYMAVLITLLHVCLAALRGRETLWIVVSKTNLVRTKVAIMLAHLLAAAASAYFPMSRPESIELLRESGFPYSDSDSLQQLCSNGKMLGFAGWMMLFARRAVVSRLSWTWSPPVTYCMHAHMVASVYHTFGTTAHVRAGAVVMLSGLILVSVSLAYDCATSVLLSLCLNYIAWALTTRHYAQPTSDDAGTPNRHWWCLSRLCFRPGVLDCWLGLPGPGSGGYM